MSLSTENLTSKELLLSLNERVLPEISKSVPIIVSGLPPVPAMEGVKVVTRRAPLLRNIKRGKGFGKNQHWPQERLNALRFPCFIIVLEGEADIELGVTRLMAAQNPRLSEEQGRFVLTLPTLSFFVVPSRQPISDSSRPHWDESRSQPSPSRLLWGHVLPSGVTFHICQSREDEHTSTRSLFVGDLQCHTLMGMLLDEMAAHPHPTPHSAALQKSYLTAILLRLTRGLASQATSVTRHEEVGPGPGEPRSDEPNASDGDTPVQRACRYIDSHLNQRLTVSLIAARAYISVAHLNSLFQAEKKMAIMQYVTAQRIARAQSLLRETDLPVQRIAEVVGFPSHEHFSRVFRKHTGDSPSALRRNKNPL